MTRTSGDGSTRAEEAAPAAGPQASEAAADRPGRLHQPWRAIVALVELIVAAVAVWLAFRLWSNGITQVPTPDGSVQLTHYHGDAISGAIGVGLVAVLLVLDAVRQVLLAVRARPRRKKGDAEPWPPFDEDVRGTGGP